MDPKTLGLLVAILLFLISLLINLVQRRYHKRDTRRWADNGESTLNFLNGLQASLSKLESACTFEMESPEKIGKLVHGARNQVKSCIADVEKNLRSFRAYRRIEKARERQRKQLEKIRKRRLGK